MFNAAEARRLANENQGYNIVVNDILKQIKKAALQGQYSIEYFNTVDPKVHSRICISMALKNLGYRMSFDENTGIYTIKW